MMEAARSAHTREGALEDVLAEVATQLGPGPFRAVTFFASPRFDTRTVSARLSAAYPDAEVLGCSTSGEISDRHSGTGGISAIGLPDGKVARASAVLARYEDGDVEKGIATALSQLEHDLGVTLRDLDPKTWVGVVLSEGGYGFEERMNAALGSAAPFLSFVGGSAGDDSRFCESTCTVGASAVHRGCALLLLEMRAPYTVVKSCHFAPTDKVLVPTRVQGRVVHEFNGQPAAVAYAAALGLTPEDLSPSVFFANPVGLVIAGEPWLRSPVQLPRLGNSMAFACEVPLHCELRLMKSTGDLVGTSAAAFARAAAELGRPIGAALLFNCVYRRLEMDSRHLHEPFVQLLKFPAAGFHTHGESWLGHINQTLTALVMG